MSNPTRPTGWLTRPTWEDLLETTGYVEHLSVEQEGERDTLSVGLGVVYDYGRRIEHARFVIYLDENSTVALAQLQLLRDALRSRVNDARSAVSETILRLRVRFNFVDTDEDEGIAYTVGLYDGVEAEPVEEHFGGPAPAGWYAAATHDFDD